MAEVLESVADTPEIQTDGVDVAEPAKISKWYRWRRDGKALIAYLLDSEVHTFAFSVAANAILSFIPFVVLLYTLANGIGFQSRAPCQTCYRSNGAVFTSLRSKAFVASGTWPDVAAVSSRHGVQVFSLIMILVACTGIFLPLEVALNQAWGVTKSRNYLMNQLVAIGLALLMAVPRNGQRRNQRGGETNAHRRPVSPH